MNKKTNQIDPNYVENLENYSDLKPEQYHQEKKEYPDFSNKTPLTKNRFLFANESKTLLNGQPSQKKWLYIDFVGKEERHISEKIQT